MLAGHFARRLVLMCVSCAGVPALAQNGFTLQNAAGLRLMLAAENTQPTLRIVLPDHQAADRSITVLFPEHVTVVRRGSTDAEQLYRFGPGAQGQAPKWRQTDQSLEYQRELPGRIRLVARATLEDDGVKFQYEFSNDSTVDYDMVTAVTDPRLTGIFHDVRLERTYVHHADGFDLLASETPGRLTMSASEWLPARYLVSFSWPVPPQRVERRSDGITYYHKSRRVDAPFIATLSMDRNWVVASFTREAGNVWSNPELTCQHVHQQTTLMARGSASLAMKMLIAKGSLEDVFRRAVAQGAAIK